MLYHNDCVYHSIVVWQPNITTSTRGQGFLITNSGKHYACVMEWLTTARVVDFFQSRCRSRELKGGNS